VTLTTPAPVDSTSSVPAAVHAASRTPYLDRELPLPNPNPYFRRIRPWQTVLILGLFAFGTPFEIYLLILLVTLIHEVGHCLGGLMAGLAFDGIRVGPVELDSYRRFHWQWNRSTIVGGHAVMLPRANSALPVRVAAYIAGGPVANILCAFLALQLIPEGDSHLAGLTRLFVGGSFILGFGNLIPFRRFGFSSDGMRLGMLLFSKSRDRWIYILRRQSAIKYGKCALAELPAAQVIDQSDRTVDNLHTRWLAYAEADGKGNYDLAAKYLEGCMAMCSMAPPDFREELILAAARFQATRCRKNDLARQWLRDGNPAKARVNRACTEALILFSEDKISEALSKVAEGGELVAQMPHGPLKNAQENAWKQLRDIFERELDSNKRASTDTLPSDARP